LGRTSYVTYAKGDVYQHAEYFPFGESWVEQVKNAQQVAFGFTGKELDAETGLHYFGARYYDARTSVWQSVDPLWFKYPNISPYIYCRNNPINAIDPDGKDIVFAMDKEAASNQGHIAVLIGNEKKGWTYVSINGTGEGAALQGVNKNADINTKIVDEKGVVITDLKKAISKANSINPNEKHSYDSFKRVVSTETEDENALNKSEKTAKTPFYSVSNTFIGQGKSCIDVAQSAFASLVKDRGLDDDGDVPGENDLIPKNWFNKLGRRVEEANKNSSDKSKHIKGLPRSKPKSK